MPDFPQSKPRPNELHCCTSWHLQKHPLALAIYDKIGELTNGGKRTYFASASAMARFFGRNPDVVRRAFSWLHAEGWVVVPGGDAAHRLDIKERRFIKHKDWAADAKHKNKCYVADLQTAWAFSGDPIVGKIFAFFSGKIRLHANMVADIKKLGISEDRFMNALEIEWEKALARRAKKDYNRTSAVSVLYSAIRLVRDLKEFDE